MKQPPQQSAVDEFFSRFRQRTLRAGDVFLEPGDEPEGVFYIESGLIRQYDISESGNVLVVNMYKQGSFIPMTWALNNQKNMWYFEAIEESLVRVAPKDTTIKYLQSDTEALFDFAKRLVSGAAGQQRRLAHLMGGGAYTRVLYELTIQLRRFGEQGDGLTCIRISESELGESAGLSREAVSRELSKLRSQGLITTSYKKICTESIERLEEELGFSV